MTRSGVRSSSAPPTAEPLTWLTRLGEIATGFSPNGTAARVMENPGGLERKVREDEQELFIPGLGNASGSFLQRPFVDTALAELGQ